MSGAHQASKTCTNDNADHNDFAGIGSADDSSGTLNYIMLASPHAWLKASQIIGEDVHHVVQGGVFVTRVLVERLVADDVDGATQTLDFSYRGADYQIDLSARDARALDKLLAPVLTAARPRGMPPVPHRTVAKAPGGVPTARTVRAWAKTEGIEVSDRGRIAAGVRKRYQAAHGA